MTGRRVSFLVATILAAPTAVLAQPVSGLYIGAGAGGNLLQDEQVRQSPGLGLTSKHLDTNIGEVGLGSVGWGFGNGLRLEAEGDFRNNRVRQVTGFRSPGQSGGNQYSYGGMVNALFDMDIGYNWIYPYFGLGAGIADSQLSDVRTTMLTTGTRYNFRGNSVNFAYQGIFGLSFPVAPVPGLSLTAEYRFYGILNNPSFHGTQVLGPSVLPVANRTGNVNISSDYNHSLLVGVRYAFNTAPPAAVAPQVAPQPAVTAARTYLVFFDWDRSDLSDRARQIVSEAAQASTRVQTTRIEVQGNADKSGTPAYNQRLSLRRAQTVAAELVRDGVARTAIDIQAFGDTKPLVETAPGVREPQNRRVAIILR